jgi:adenosylcobinamide-GDP ribazoletransferase
VKRQWHIFLTAVIFFTRIPVSRFFEYRDEYAPQAARYFPLVGLLIGVLTAGVFLGAQSMVSLPLAVLVSMAFSVLLTGAFHEDGFADMCDGLGGGWEKEQVLSIMKDSRLGTYGALGLFFVIMLKYGSLISISLLYIPLAMVSGHIISRVVSTSLIYDMDYIQDEDLKKIKALVFELSLTDLFFVLAVGLVSLCWLPFLSVLVVVLAMVLTRQIFRIYLATRLGGYTGDCLGGVQQVSEVVFYILVGVLTSL